MENKDSKIRLFLEFCHPKSIHIIKVTRLFDDENTIKRMYHIPKVTKDEDNKQCLYVWITDKAIIDKVKNEKDKKKAIQTIQEEGKIEIEFNVKNIDLDDRGIDEEREIIFAKVNVDNATFIYDYEKQREEKLDQCDLLYALVGSIKDKLFNNEPLMMNHSINIKDKGEESKIITGLNDEKSLEQSKEEKTPIKDGHWFLVKDLSKITFICYIQYKLIEKKEENEQNQNNPPQTNVKNESKQEKENMTGFEQPMQFSITDKESSKIISIYQSKSCNNHSRRNDLYCKTCNEFCCLQCYGDVPPLGHKGHKVKLIDEVLSKMEEQSKILKERVTLLKKIIEDEMKVNRNELNRLKNKNTEVVECLKKWESNKKMIIKNEELKRAKNFAALSNEVLRIIDDFHKKENYLNILYSKGDMTSYLANYFLFLEYLKTDLVKNLSILERKINALKEKYSAKNSSNDELKI